MINDFLEKTIEDIIFENKQTIHERGFIKFYEHTIRQLSLPSGKRIDLFTYEIVNQVLKVKVIELKRSSIDIVAIWQILDYWYSLTNLTAGLFKSCEPELVLVGATLTNEAVLLHDAGINISYYLYRYQYDGIHFNKCKYFSFVDYFSIETTPPIEGIEFVLKLKEPYNPDLVESINNQLP